LTNLPVNLKLLFEYVVIQIKSKQLKPNQNDLNVTLEPTVFEMDAVIVSTFNKIQSQNVMKVEHKTIKELQQKDSNLNRRVSYNSWRFSSFYWNIDRKPVIRGLSGNRVLFIHREFEWRTNSLATNMVWV
jgi:iron complex outermembrane receptor protein